MPISTKNDRLSKRDHITKGAELRDGKNTTIISMLQMVIYFLRMCDASMLNHLHYTNLGMLIGQRSGHAKPFALHKSGHSEPFALHKSGHDEPLALHKSRHAKVVSR